ncbi:MULTISPECIES: M20 aminoacylase family protein [unclassified Mesorhizobium]|uniref:M20 aminoacylase family protein n=1 Tax=unclassified Mesorhizobium TaxID=325217 RepID=UPI0019286692|nr:MULTISPECIES: M20 aminoacylase family protein [unclassified Mesorhizobium]BCG97333.1 amidohydrolase [Mesorhizobium sp. 131-2-1]BCH04404.1 amidohydrolase [Mesorhizobium sp. 131-2-5]
MQNFAAYRDVAAEAIEWRRHLHRIPEVGFELHGTATFVHNKLISFGIDEIATGIANTGIVGVIRGRHGEGPIIGLRADMDALPIVEASGKPWASTELGKMHACGHDGHTAMLLAAAKHLARTRDFKGSVALVFQPAEEVEWPSGGFKMVQEGIMDRFGISKIFGMHNWPGMDIGKFGICAGGIMAAQDDFDVVVKGRGGHAAAPHRAVDPVVIAAQIILGFQSLVTRHVDPLESIVISVTKLSASQAYNVIPDHVTLSGTVRTLSPHLRNFAETEMARSATGIAEAFGAQIDFHYLRSVPVTLNSPAETAVAAKVARGIVGDAQVDDQMRPIMGAEDFAYLLEARPGAFVFLGNGNTAEVHHPAYDFNDASLIYGMAYWVGLAETVLGNRNS